MHRAQVHRARCGCRLGAGAGCARRGRYEHIEDEDPCRRSSSSRLGRRRDGGGDRVRVRTSRVGRHTGAVSVAARRARPAATGRGAAGRCRADPRRHAGTDSGHRSGTARDRVPARRRRSRVRLRLQRLRPLRVRPASARCPAHRRRTVRRRAGRRARSHSRRRSRVLLDDRPGPDARRHRARPGVAG